MVVAMGTNSSPLHYKNLPVHELQQSIEIYTEYIEQRNRAEKTRR